MVTAPAADFKRVLRELVAENAIGRLGGGVKANPYRYYQRVYADRDD